SMPLSVQAFLNASLVVLILAVVASGFGIGLRLMLRGCHATFRACFTIAAVARPLFGHYGGPVGVDPLRAAVSITAAIAAIWLFARTLEQRAELRVALAPEIANYLLGHFDTLDSDGDGNIVRTDLMIALSKGSFYHDDVILLTLALQDIQLIGH